MRPWRTPDGLVCHVLLIETPKGLALVDSGLGLLDRKYSGKRFGPARHYVRPVFDDAEAAVSQPRSVENGANPPLPEPGSVETEPTYAA